MIDVSRWGNFIISDIFECKTCPNSVKIDLDEGNIPYISRTAVNNGRDGQVDVDCDKITKGNCITIGAEGLYAFYQDKDFATGVKIYTLRCDEMDRKVGLFISTLLNMEVYKYNYGRARILDKIKQEQIKLPIDFDGNPDWHYMRIFIEELETKSRNNRSSIKSSLETKNKAIRCDFNVDSNNWRYFYLHRLFDTEMGNGIDAVATTNYNPKYNYVSRDSNGNGVVAFIDEIEGETPFPAGAMSLALGGSFLGSCFIQKEPFYTAQNVGILKEKEPLSIHSKLFVATLIRNECKTKYQAFGRELNSHFRKDFAIKLPVKVDSSGVLYDENKLYSDEGFIPDWEWMDRYIKSLPFADKF